MRLFSVHQQDLVIPPPASLEEDPIEIDIGVRSLDQLLSPLLDSGIYFCIEVGDGAGTYFAAP